MKTKLTKELQDECKLIAVEHSTSQGDLTMTSVVKAIEYAVQCCRKTPEKIMNVGEQNMKDFERYFSCLDFNDPFKVALGFGTWLNLYFRPWSPSKSTWMDSEKFAYTTEELLNEFISECKVK